MEKIKEFGKITNNDGNSKYKEKLDTEIKIFENKAKSS